MAVLDELDLAFAAWPSEMVAVERGIYRPVEIVNASVGIIMGSPSDLGVMAGAGKVLDDNIGYEVIVASAHREPDRVQEYAGAAVSRGLKVIIAGAGLSAALPGVVAAHTELPVIGVPLTSKLTAAGGLDAILSTIQMPPGVPVLGVGLDNPKNAGIAAARIVGLLCRKLDQ